MENRLFIISAAVAILSSFLCFMGCLNAGALVHTAGMAFARWMVQPYLAVVAIVPLFERCKIFTTSACNLVLS